MGLTASHMWTTTLSVPYWSGCSVKRIRARPTSIKDKAFSPLLVGVLSETGTLRPGLYGLCLSVPYWSGCSVKQISTHTQNGSLLCFQSPTGRGAQ